jgi:hypothetical protein
MKKQKFQMSVIVMVILGVLVGLMATSAVAQTEAEIKEAMKKDKTGTNPMNFTWDARLYDEYRWLNTEGDGNQNIGTLQLSVPFANDNWQLRIKVRQANLQLDTDNDGHKDVNESGLGDTDVRFMTLPILTTWGLATGVEFFLPTATDDALGSGATTVGPFVFLGFFNVFGKGSLFVPGYQHNFSVYEQSGRESVHSGLIDMFCVKTFAGGQAWGYLDPQIVLDYKNSKEYMLVEIQAGAMLDKLLGTTGHSAYIMPSFGAFEDRPYDFSLEAGYKIIW